MRSVSDEREARGECDPVVERDPPQARVSSSSRPSKPKSSRMLPAVRVSVVDAVLGDLLDVGAEDLEPDLLVDDPSRLVERERWDVVDELLELLDVDVRA